ncbi:MAG: DUF2281 domain-containing protein [Cyanobacteria bacterium J06627_28]|jgi:hypothetical protein
MNSLEQAQADIQSLPEEAQALLIDFIAILKKRYVEPRQTTDEESTYEKFKSSGFIGCASVEEDLSTTYKQVLAEQWNQKHDHR